MAFGGWMAKGPPAPSLMFPQPVHIWVSLSGMDELGPAPLEMGNGDVSTLLSGARWLHQESSVHHEMHPVVGKKG